MASIRKWLDGAGFDWEEGTIVVQTTDDDECPGWGRLKSGEVASRDHHLVAKEFGDELGAPECPRFWAICGTRIYFPHQYGGTTGLTSVSLVPDPYLGDPGAGATVELTPYPGG